ncbi:MAG TPA: ThiF family adenylyltransferase [Planctomycetota bacterium]|nr:ThiF family adenylyltransferase [Planctomycetota bacterium]
MEFSYERAFARNIGLVTEAEQKRLRQTRVGLAGMGGVGGAHLQALARIGIGAFHLADPDRFDVVNFNRQLGASMPTVGRGKAEVCAQIAAEINPEASLRTFPAGINEENIGEFLSGVDVVIDGIEFFRIEDHRLLHRACRAAGIPVIVAGPIGYGSVVLVFTPQGCSFDEYFKLDDGMTHAEKIVAFGLGNAPGLVSDVDPSHVDIENQRGPALVSACMLAAAAAATEVLKIVCGRGRFVPAPHGIYYDPYRRRVLTMRPRPSLTRTLRGRILRWLSFRRFPAVRAMHERELAERNAAEAGAPAARERIQPLTLTSS